ncbi:hypothetical protein PM082_016276 [Marasmius tenuissimus]|nr:hypothetical protein PM082_016276 [Marasmius tenuissimus]
MDVDEDTSSGFDTRKIAGAIDFELPDYWDEGEVLEGRDRWPVCVSMNMVLPTHFLDASPQEEASTSIRVLLMFSFLSPNQTTLQGMRMLGPGEIKLSGLKELIKVFPLSKFSLFIHAKRVQQEGEKYAKEIYSALTSKLKDEDIRRNQKARDRFVNRI